MKRLSACLLSLLLLGLLVGFAPLKTSPNYGYPDGTPGQNEVREIIIHHWGTDASTLSGTEGWLCNPASQVSAHYVVSGTTVRTIVDPSNAAWHAGSRWHNMHSIGIECNPRCSQTDMETVAGLIADIWHQYGRDLPIVGHNDVANTNCPGRWYGKLDVLEEMAAEIYDQTP